MNIISIVPTGDTLLTMRGIGSGLVHMKKIQLDGHTKRSKVSGWALVDDSDFGNLNKYKWSKCIRGHTCYAIRRFKKNENKKGFMLMHRQIMNPSIGLVTDHIDRDGLNNQRKNLRICTNLQNSFNRGK